MSNYDNTNTGILMKNENMREGKQDPGYKGSINVDGVEYWLSAWVNVGKANSKLAGQKYFHLKIQKIQAKTQPKAAQKTRPDPDDIDF